MADADDRDRSLGGGAGRGNSPGGPSVSGGGNQSSGGSANNSRSDSGSGGRSSPSGSGRSGSSSSSSNQGSGGNRSSSSSSSSSNQGSGGAGAGRGNSPGGPSIGGGNRSSTSGNANVTARSGTGGIGSDRAASATPSIPGGYGFRAHGNSAQTARADTPSYAHPVASGRAHVSATHTTPDLGFGRTSVAGARSDTPSSYQPVGSNLASTVPDFMRGRAAPPDFMTAPATAAVSRYSQLSPTPTGLTPQDIARQAATLTTRPGAQQLAAAAPATAAGMPAMTTRAQMDVMETLRQASTMTPNSYGPTIAPRGLGTAIAAGTPTAGYDTVEETARQAAAQVEAAAQDRRERAVGGTPTAGYDPTTTASTDPVHPDSLTSSVNPVGNMSMEVGGPAQDLNVAAPPPGDRPIGGAFYGSNLTSPARLGYDTASQPPGTVAGLEMADAQHYATDFAQRADLRATPPALGDFQTASADIRSTVPAQTQVAANTRSVGPTGVNVLNNQPDVVRTSYTPGQYAQYRADQAPTQVAENEPVDDGENPDVPATDEAQDTVPAATQDFNNDDQYNAPPAVVEDNPPETTTQPPNTLRQVVRDILTPNEKIKRGARGTAAVIAGDVALGVMGLPGLVNTGVQVLTGDSIPGHIWDATHGRYGENQYQQGSQHRSTETAGDGPRQATTGRSTTANTTTVPPPRPDTNDEEPGTTFEERYLADNTWRPTPLQKWGPNPTHSEYV